MSTKTTYKRIALVAVAAMGFGLLTVAPSSAAQQADTLALSTVTTANSTGEIGTAVSTTLTQSFFGNNGDTMSVMAAIVSYPAGFAVAPTLTLVHNGIGGINALQGTDRVQLNDTATVSGVVTGATTVSFTPTGAGTYVFSFTPYRGTSADQAAGTAAVAPTSAAVTWTVTVAAGTVPDATTTSITNSYGVATGSADKSVRIAAGSSLAGAATIVVTPLTDAAASTGSSVISVSVSGPGTVLINQDSTGGTSSGYKTQNAGFAAGAFYVHLFSDGTVGTSTITITVGTATKTETVYFYGAAASVTTTTTTPTINSGSGAVATAILTATVKDANGNVVPGVTVYAVSGTTTVFASTSATTGSAGTAVISVLGLVAGTSAVTVQNVATGSTATYSAAAVSIRSGSNTTANVVLSLDKATYSQGEAAVLTVTQTDAAGSLIADGTNSPFTTAVSSRALTAGSLPGDSLVTTGSNLGVLTYKINVPNTSGAFTISATAGSGFTGTYSVTATVSPSAAETAAAAAIAAAADTASAAVDAAAEATDAANAATDAANAAAEAADAATAAAQDAADAIAALSTQVADLIASLTAQISAQKAAITALTNLVIKIQKKVKA